MATDRLDPLVFRAHTALKLAFKLLVPLAVFVGSELILRDVLNYRAWLGNMERRTLAAYKDAPWIDQYLTDLTDCASQSAHKHQRRYARYVLQTINEDCATPTVNYANRIRRTWNPAPAQMAPGAQVYEVATFGGSTLEGVGAIDDETIPSQFSRLANAGAASGFYHVTNYGVSGYTFTQSVVALITLLREGRHFDDVIMYSGANDVEYAYELGEAGALYGEDVLRARLEGSASDWVGEIAKEQMNACVLCMTGAIAIRHVPVLENVLSPLIVRLRGAIRFNQARRLDGVELFAQGIADYYEQSHALLLAIASAYHLRHLEFWQPTLMDDDRYAPGEASLAHADPRLTDVKRIALQRRAREATVAKHLSDFHDLSHELAERQKACYVDGVHLSGEGNKVIAARIYEIWKQRTAAGADEVSRVGVKSHPVLVPTLEKAKGRRQKAKAEERPPLNPRTGDSGRRQERAGD